MFSHAHLMTKDSVVINTHFRGQTDISFEFKWHKSDVCIPIITAIVPSISRVRHTGSKDEWMSLESEHFASDAFLLYTRVASSPYYVGERNTTALALFHELSLLYVRLYQWRILIRKLAIVEWNTIRQCTVPLDLTSGSGFATDMHSLTLSLYKCKRKRW